MNNNRVVQPENTVRFHRNKKMLWIFSGLIFIAVVVSTIFEFYFIPLKRSSPSSWHGIKVGVSTKKDVVKTLGKPEMEKQTPLGYAFFYNSDNSAFPNTLIFNRKQRVSSIFVQVAVGDNIKFSEWTKNYGQPKKEVYNSFSAFTKTYLFPKKGVAVIANTNFDRVYAIHYFQPTSLNNYLSIWGKYFFEESPYLY